jgi:hypothetical protein
MYGLIFLAALVFLARRHWTPLRRSLLIVLGAVIPFLLIGSVLGALDHPVNLIKMREFVEVAGGPMIGLMLAVWIRRSRLGPKVWRFGGVAALVAVLFLVSGMVRYAKHDWIRKARNLQVPDWGFTSEQAKEFRGKVFLSGHHAFYSFYPAYSFFFANQHYAHPAADFTNRFRFLELLQDSPDSYLFYVCLRFNRFNAVDFYWPLKQKDDLTIPANLSNYPNRFDGRTLVYRPDLTSDSKLFFHTTPAGVVELAPDTLVGIRQAGMANLAEGRREDAARWAENIDRYLSPEGISRLEAYLRN